MAPAPGPRAHAPTPEEIIAANPLAGYPDGYSGHMQVVQSASDCADCKSGCADCGESAATLLAMGTGGPSGTIAQSVMSTPSTSGAVADLASIRRRATEQLVAAMSLLEAVSVEEELARKVVRAGSRRG